MNIANDDFTVSKNYLSSGKIEQSEVLTFGMKLVGINFNPSGDAKVNKAKELSAQLADLARESYLQTNMHQELGSTLYHHTIGEILNAQMNLVKLLTLKY